MIMMLRDEDMLETEKNLPNKDSYGAVILQKI